MIVTGREEYVPGADGEARAQLLLRYRLSAATADAYAGAGFTAIVQDVALGEDLETYVGLVRTDEATAEQRNHQDDEGRAGRLPGAGREDHPGPGGYGLPDPARACGEGRRVRRKP